VGGRGTSAHLQAREGWGPALTLRSSVTLFVPKRTVANPKAHLSVTGAPCLAHEVSERAETPRSPSSVVRHQLQTPPQESQ
jgi:hypothetical protein